MGSQVAKESSSGVTFPQGGVLWDRKQRKMKREEIVRACDQGDLKQLVQLASSSGGLLDDELRQSACMTFIPFNFHLTKLLTCFRAHFAGVRSATD